MVVGEVSPSLGAPSVPRSLQILLYLGALHTTTFGESASVFYFSINALPPVFLSLPCDGVSFPKPTLSPQLSIPAT